MIVSALYSASQLMAKKTEAAQRFKEMKAERHKEWVKSIINAPRVDGETRIPRSGSKHV